MSRLPESLQMERESEGRGMRRVALIAATILLALVAMPVSLPNARSQAVPMPTETLTVFGETTGGRQVFAPNQILVPQVPIHIVLTFHNNDTVMDHSFTINDANGTATINTNIIRPGVNVTLNFTLFSMTKVLYNGTNFTPEASGTGIRFYCIPHAQAGMVGQILLAGLTAPPAEKGILLRAYWIGIIGIAATLVWVGISYYVIKSSSRHFMDNREHVRKGLP